MGADQERGLRNQVVCEILLLVGALGLVFVIVITVPELATVVLYLAAVVSTAMAFAGRVTRTAGSPADPGRYSGRRW